MCPTRTGPGPGPGRGGRRGDPSWGRRHREAGEGTEWNRSRGSFPESHRPPTGDARHLPSRPWSGAPLSHPVPSPQENGGVGGNDSEPPLRRPPGRGPWGVSLCPTKGPLDSPRGLVRRHPTPQGQPEGWGFGGTSRSLRSQTVKTLNPTDSTHPLPGEPRSPLTGVS